jgi:hypothetical protein
VSTGAGRGSRPLRITNEATVGREAGVRSVQKAELELPAEALERVWNRAGLECLGQRYWYPIDRGTRGLLHVMHRDGRPTVTLAGLPPALMRLHAPAYSVAGNVAEVRWRIGGGLLVASTGRDTGLLRIEARRTAGSREAARVAVQITVAVEDFHPRLRGRGGLTRMGTWLYRGTQLRWHVWQAREFLHALAAEPAWALG